MRRWHKVSMRELKALWSNLHERGEWFNGCTHWELARIYGAANIKHKAGYGYYKLV